MSLLNTADLMMASAQQLASIRARWWRIRGVAADGIAPDYWWRVPTLMMFADFGATDITDSSYAITLSPNAGEPASAAFDRDDATYWGDTANPTWDFKPGSWLGQQFPAAVGITEIRWVPWSNSQHWSVVTAVDYSLNGTDWTQVDSRSTTSSTLNIHSGFNPPAP